MATAAVNLFCAAASSLQKLGENYYKGGAVWENYCRRVNYLRQQLEEFTSLLKSYGMQTETDTDVNLQKRLDEAVASVKDEEARLKKLTQKRPWLGLVAFPDHLLGSISVARDALDDVRMLYRVREENRAMLEKEVLSNSLPDRIPPDPSYVHLKDTESKVYAALEDPSGPCFVLLHGGPGRGKSTLARHTVVHYSVDRPLSTGTETPEGQKELIFDNVFFLECGPNADASAKLLELLQRLGSCNSTRPGEDRNSGASTSVEKVLVKKMLHARLSQRKFLIILDDVWEKKFLEDFVEVFGTKVKCLVTSQNASLMQSSSKVEIQVDWAEASSILARHACLPNDAIPPKLQDILDRVVQKADRLPLALACFAAAISKKRPTDIDEWREAEKSFLNLLNEENTLPIYNRMYSKSLWSSMRLPVDLISNEARQLLLLASICAGPSVPEEVMKIFCQHNQMTEVAAAFTKRRNDLEDQSLLDIQSETLRWVKEKGRFKRKWALHGLLKEFIKTGMKEQREVLVRAFFGEEEIKVGNLEERTLMILYALYFDRDLAEIAARKLGQDISCFSETKRAAVEPIIWLIHNPTNEEWSEDSAATARRVLDSYICHNRPRDEDMDHLLLLPFSKKATDEAAKKMKWIRYLEGWGETKEGWEGSLGWCRGFGYEDIRVDDAGRVIISDPHLKEEDITADALGVELIITSNLFDPFFPYWLFF